MVVVRLVFGGCLGGRGNQQPIRRQSFYQSAALLDADIGPQNSPREKQLCSTPVQDLIDLNDSSLEASISESPGPLEQKQAIENEFHKSQNTFSISGKLEALVQTNISAISLEASFMDKPKSLNELKLNRQLKKD